ncbi:amidophosphoribosyltransferase [Deinococcus cellulosilyticus NBRC 106333 = KACC 11606]|uniref:Amidophosphoribosyltransferase n=1 Tax=Deinococcus cellulosilyticus (strain DSM 18568 / NBRC 106333 / KACC 11606 / 5516J-15) TaxID=1223518 RepID=A0A511N513_DEIC1|nr:amidophosphoribosyltransferase [Deinococcus cellulosilyticus NBRC 106333 = KACC 11606]
MFPQTCPGCHRPLKDHQAVCPECTPKTAHLTSESVLRDTSEPHLVYLGPAEGKLRRMVHALKYHHNHKIAQSVAPALSRSIPQSWKLDVICPVPLHPRRERERGYNQSRLLGEAIGARLGVSTRDLLKRVVYTHQQARLRQQERNHNMNGVFALNASVQNLNVLLVDDVLSTGATLNASAQILQQGGANAVYFLVIAR